MNTLEQEKQKYNPVDNTFYHAETPLQVIRILEDSRRNRTRLRLHYGDTQTGHDWMDEWDMTGHIGRSMGPIRIPLLIKNSRSTGGGGILDHCIIRIRTASGNRELYRHPLYNRPAFTIAYDPTGELSQSPKRIGRPDASLWPFAILEDGSVNARFKTAKQRSAWFAKMDIPDPTPERIAKLKLIIENEKISEANGATPQFDDNGKVKQDIATCGTCGESWNDALITGCTPAPSARCPYEYIHAEIAELKAITA